MRNRNRALFALALLVAGLLFSSGCKKANKSLPVWLLALTNHESVAELRLDYLGSTLLDGVDAFSVENLPEPTTAHGSEVAHPHWPALLSLSGERCLAALGGFYYANEAGLRFAWCGGQIEEHQARLSAFLETIQSLDSPTAWPELSIEPLELRVETPGQIRNRIGPVRASLDGGSASISFLAREQLAGNELRLHAAIPLRRSNPGDGAVPRRFPLAFYHLLVTEDRLLLLYHMPSEFRRLLTITIEGSEASKAAYHALSRIERRNESLIEASSLATAGEVAVSEIFFQSQGRAGEEFFELASKSDQPLLAALYLRTDQGFEIDDEMLFLPRSVALYARRDNDSMRLRERLELNMAGITSELNYDDFRALGASSLRTLTAEAARGDEVDSHADLAPARDCLNGPLCGSYGIHPDYAELLRTSSGEESALDRCRVEDFRLTEFNPFGIFPDDDQGQPVSQVRTTGKFIELMALRHCRSGAILLRAGDAILDLGEKTLHSSEILLFTASDTLFSAPLQIVSDLRSLRADDPIDLFDLYHGEERSLYSPSSDGVDAIEYIYGSRNFPAPMLRRVHSLVLDPDSGELLFHGHYGKGLRSTLNESHAMTPGYPPELPPAPTSVAEAIAISEIYPSGAWNEDGISAPGDEFLELHLPPRATFERGAGALTFEVVRHSDGRRRHYRLPLPWCSASCRLALFRDPPTCFSLQRPYLRHFSFDLPNSPSDYQLYRGFGVWSGSTEAAWQLLDSIAIDQELYGSLDGFVRRSLARRCYEPGWVLHDSNSDSLCSRSYASPALPWPGGEVEKCLR